MTINFARLLLVSAALFLGVGSAPAQQPQKDAGKKLLVKLFNDAVTAANEATVRVKCDGKEKALGTVVTADGYILTKGSELRGKLTCVFRDDTAHPAEYVGYHKASDLALLKVEMSGLKPVTFAEAKYASVGNWVAVPGLNATPVGVGVVSVAARKLYGEEAIVQNLDKGTLGIQMRDLQSGDGALIVEVKLDAAASKAGLKPKDILFEFDGKPIKSPDSLIEVMEDYRPNESVTVRVRRGDEELAVRVKLSNRNEWDQSAFQNGMGGWLSGRRTGFPQVIQHDTVINPDACGGPLVDLDGRVLGINIARAGRVETWTLPAEVVTPILKDLKAGKYPVSTPTKAVK
jgi:serine protease Do